MKKGSLVVVGSGIKGFSHLTTESKGWIREADVVLYCVSDPVSEIWIKKNSKRSIDLYQFYGNYKQRIDTYNQMVDETLKYVRQGCDTCVVYYGHPGIFVYPSHKAIRIAKSEGYRAAMLPGISALDSLCADLGVDPSVTGMQTIEATDLLLRKRKLNTDQNVVIWQIGCVGDLGFAFNGYDSRNLGILVDYLEKFYDKDHVVTIYEGAQYLVCSPRIQKIPLCKLRYTRVTGISTLYIPPKDRITIDKEMVKKLGLQSRSSVTPNKILVSSPENNKKDSLKKSNLGQYSPVPEHSELATLLVYLAQSPRLFAKFNRDPELVANLYANLSPDEKDALWSKHPGKIRLAIKKLSGRKHLEGITILNNKNKSIGGNYN